MSAKLFAFAFPLARNFRRVACRLFLPARCLLAATRACGCSCPQPFATARSCSCRGFRRAPPKFGFLSCAGNLLRLALGNGIWVGGIEIEALDTLALKNPRLEVFEP